MKTSLKVILLFVAIVAVVGSLLFFAKSRLDPPQAAELDGEQAAQVRLVIGEIRQGLSTDILNQRWFEARHLIGFLDDNQLLRPGESDTLKTMLMEKYVPAFVRKCEMQFNLSVWDDGDLNKMRSRIKLLRKEADSKGHSVIGLRPSLSGQLDRIGGVLGKYDQARDLVGRSEYSSLSKSKERIRMAQQLKADTYLRNNSSLRSELDSVPIRLVKSHYDYLQRSVEALANPGTSWEAFQERYDAVGREVSLFADSARSVYGHYISVSDLRSEMRGYYHDADRNFNSRSPWDILWDNIF